MRASPTSPVLLETAVNELPLAIGQFIRRLRSESNPHELNLAEMAVLARLEQAGQMTTAELARLESVKPQSMGTILAGLEKARLVQRRPHPTDGRRMHYLLTSKGMGIRRLRAIEKRQWLADAIATLQPDEQRILVSAAKLIKRLAGA